MEIPIQEDMATQSAPVEIRLEEKVGQRSISVTGATTSN